MIFNRIYIILFKLHLQLQILFGNIKKIYLMTDSETKHAIRMILLSASLAGMSYISFQNGLLLSYFSHLKVPSASILILLSILPISLFFFIIPFSYLSDKLGKKFIGNIGLIFQLIGFSLISAIGFFPENYRIMSIGLGIAAFGAGQAMNVGSWYALIHPIIPEKIRGRFFGLLRLTWQSVSFLFMLIAIYILENYPSLKLYQAVLGLITILMAIRILFYKRIPELDKRVPNKKSLLETILNVISIPEFLPFCAYCFVLTLFTGACPQIFNLIEKDVLKFSEAEIVFIGNLLILGSLAGFFIGGRMVDRIGTKYVFLFCHLGFGTIMFLFLLRDTFQFEYIFFVGTLTILFGIVQAASSIAMTSETLVIIPEANKSLAVGVWFTLFSGGTGLSGILSGKALELKVFSASWTLLDQNMTNYDVILLIFATMVLLMTVTLGLIPSFIKKTPAQWIPHNH